MRVKRFDRIKVENDIISEIKKSIVSQRAYIKAESQIVFLFGAKSNTQRTTARDSFYDYTKKHLQDYLFLLAEDFYRSFGDSPVDLLTLEDELASYTDCVLIILESPGAIAELGAFSLKSELVKKILAINERAFMNEDSFINKGPLAKIQKESKFSPVIHAKFESILASIGEIEKSLSKNLQRKRSVKVEFDTYDKFNGANFKKFRLMLVRDLVTLFSPVKFEEILYILRYIYDTDKFLKINFELSFLISVGLIRKEVDFYINTYKHDTYFYSFPDLNIIDLRAKVLNY